MTVPPQDTHGCRPMCELCRADLFAQLRGVARSRGHFWARGIAEVIPIDRTWPFTDKSRAIALRKVADLTRDEPLREMLATEVEDAAAQWWNRALEQVG